MNDFEIRNVAIDIIECFEDLLDEKDITIPSEDRTGDEGEARIFGTEYYELEASIINILKSCFKKTKRQS